MLYFSSGAQRSVFIDLVATKYAGHHFLSCSQNTFDLSWETEPQTHFQSVHQTQSQGSLSDKHNSLHQVQVCVLHYLETYATRWQVTSFSHTNIHCWNTKKINNIFQTGKEWDTWESMAILKSPWECVVRVFYAVGGGMFLTRVQLCFLGGTSKPIVFQGPWFQPWGVSPFSVIFLGYLWGGKENISSIDGEELS